MTLPTPLTEAYRRRRLLIVWAGLPFTLAAWPPANRALAIRQWQSRIPPLPPGLAKGWGRLPPLPCLSLDPSDRVEQTLAGGGAPIHPVRTRQDVPISGRHSLLKLAGDLTHRSGVILSRAEIDRLQGDPDKRYLLAEAGRQAAGGAVLLVAADPAGEDFRAWWAVLEPALGQPPLFALGRPEDTWPAGITPLGIALAPLAEALAAITPEPPEPEPATQSAAKTNIIFYGPASGVVIGDDTEVEQHFDRSPAGEPPDWERLMARLDGLAGQLQQGLADLKRGQAALYRRVGPEQRETLAQVLQAVQEGRLAQVEMEATLKDLRRAMRGVLNRGIPMDPELRAAITDLTETVESSLSLDQKLELALPLVPLLLNYKIELGAGSDLDLHDLWDELRRRWQRLLAIT